MKEMLSFSSWTSLSGITSLLNNYGIGILYNMFYGVAVNAAIGISNQIHAAVWTLLGISLLRLILKLRRIMQVEIGIE